MMRMAGSFSFVVLAGLQALSSGSTLQSSRDGSMRVSIWSNIPSTKAISASGRHGALGIARGDRIQDGEVVVDGAVEAGLLGHVSVVDEADAPEDGVERPQRMLEERLAGGRQHHLVDPAVELVEFRQRQPVAPLAQQALHVQHLVAMGRAGTLGGKPDDEALDVAAQMQEHALAGQIDRRNLQAVTRADHDQRVGGEAVDGVVNRRAAKAGEVLEILHGEEAPGRELAADQQLLDALIGQFEQVDAVAALRRARFLRLHQFRPACALRHVVPPSRSSLSGSSLEGKIKHIVIFYKRSYGLPRSVGFRRDAAPRLIGINHSVQRPDRLSKNARRQGGRP
jgi:hypothetical protein